MWRELRQCDCAQSQKSAAQCKFTNPTSTLTLRLSFCTVSCPCLYIARQQLQHLSCSPLAVVSAQSCVSTPHPSWPASKSTAPAASAVRARIASEPARSVSSPAAARLHVLVLAHGCCHRLRSPPRCSAVPLQGAVGYCDTALRFGMQRAN